jgi:hypothetical protein
VHEIIVTRNGVRQAGADSAGPLMEKLKVAAERSLYVFAKTIMGFRDFTTNLHKPMCDLIEAVPPLRKMILIPRDCFKTSIAKALVIHMTIQQPATNPYKPGKLGADMRILYCAETTDRAETRIGWIKRTYESNKMLRAFWPEIMWDDPQAQKAKWNQQRLLLRRQTDYDECTIERTGVDAAITGGHFDAMVKDDLISIKARNEPTTMQSAIEWDSASAFLFDDYRHGLEWYFGTRWGAYDLYSSIQGADPDLWVYKRAIIEDGLSIFPERHSLDAIARLQRKAELEGTEDLFYLNFMNTVVGSKMQDFKMSDLRSFTLDGDRIAYQEIVDDADLLELFHSDDTPPDRDAIELGRRGVIYTWS